MRHVDRPRHVTGHGVDGLVLAAETAIGRYPVRCVSMVSRMIQGIERHEAETTDYYPTDAVSLLVEPHGGRLVRREAGPADLDGIEYHPRLVVSERDLMDCEQLAYGTYSPLHGFMGREELESVLDHNRLPSGETWTLPILLQVPAASVAGFGVGDRVQVGVAVGVATARLAGVGV